MEKQYTLEKIKEMIKLNQVNMSNIRDIMNSLKDYNFNSDIKEIFVALSNDENLPKELRANFKDAVESYAMIPQTNEPQEVMVEPPVEQYKPIPRGSYIEQEQKDEEISLGNDAALGALVAFAASRGLKVLSNNPGLNGKPEISFELNYESKPYLDHILLELYNNKEDINVDLTRIAASGKEALTLEIDNPELSAVELQEKSKKLFSDVNRIINETDKEKDYETVMPAELKALKDKFHGDDPNIPDEDFKIGYSRKNGENSYYVVANSKEQAIEVSELMGYEIKEDRGGNIFELETDGKTIEGSKLDVASENVNKLDEVKDVDDGLTNIDVNYNNNNFVSDDYLALEKMTSSGSGEIRVSTPAATPNQRVVEVSNNNGETSTIVFTDGDSFDNYAAKFENSNGPTTTGYYSSSETELESSPVNNVNGETTEYQYSNKAYVKSLGTHPAMNSSQSANTNFWALIAFILVLIIGCGIIYLVFGG